MWNMSSDRVAYVYVGDGSFTRVSEAALPGVTTKTEEELRAVVADYNSVDEVRNAAGIMLSATKTITLISMPLPESCAIS